MIKDFQEYKEIVKFMDKFILDQKTKLQILDMCGLHISCIGDRFFTKAIQSDIEEIKDTKMFKVLEKLISKKDGLLVLTMENNDIIGDITYEKNDLRLRFSYINDIFNFSILKNDIEYITNEENNFFFFAYLIMHPEFIDSNSFHYSMTYNEITKRYLKKKDVLLDFDNIVYKDNLLSENIDKFTINRETANGNFITDKSCIILSNPYDTDDNKLRAYSNALEMVVDFNLDEYEDYEVLGFDFSKQITTTSINMIKTVIPYFGYSPNKIGKDSVTINNHIYQIVIVPMKFDVNVSIMNTPMEIYIYSLNNNRVSFFHPSFVSKKILEPALKDGKYTFGQLFDIIQKLEHFQLENFYSVFFNDANDNEKSIITHYASFDDALRLSNGFLEKITNNSFININLEVSKKYGEAFGNFENGAPKLYCVVAKDEHLAKFYTDMLKFHETY